MTYKTGQPIMFIGVGQKYTHLERRESAASGAAAVAFERGDALFTTAGKSASEQLQAIYHVTVRRGCLRRRGSCWGGSGTARTRGRSRRRRWAGRKRSLGASDVFARPFSACARREDQRRLAAKNLFFFFVPATPSARIVCGATVHGQPSRRSVSGWVCLAGARSNLTTMTGCFLRKHTQNRKAAQRRPLKASTAFSVRPIHLEAARAKNLALTRAKVRGDRRSHLVSVGQSPALNRPAIDNH